MNRLVELTTYLPNKRIFQKVSRMAMRCASSGPIRTRYGFKVNYLTGDDDTALRKMCIVGDYEAAFWNRLGRFAKDTVVDVGAHEGFVSLYLSRFAPVIACEPNPILADRLRKNVALNKARIQVHAVAIGDQPGDLLFHCNSSAGSLIEYPHIDTRDKVTVPVKTLDSIVAKEKIGLIKIDTEGYELEVLKGAEQLIARDRPVISFEINLTLLALMPRSAQELLDFLPARGYKLFQLADNEEQLVPFTWLNRRIDNLFALPV